MGMIKGEGSGTKRERALDSWLPPPGVSLGARALVSAAFSLAATSGRLPNGVCDGGVSRARVHLSRVCARRRKVHAHTLGAASAPPLALLGEYTMRTRTC